MLSTEFFEMLIVFSAIVLVVKTIADYKIKTNLIKQGLVDEKVKYLFARSQTSSSLSSLKWGLVLIGIGVALFLREWVSFNDETIFGLMFLFAGIAFIVSHALAKKEEDNIKQ